jgi:hypothetical protein
MSGKEYEVMKAGGQFDGSMAGWGDWVHVNWPVFGCCNILLNQIQVAA